MSMRIRRHIAGRSHVDDIPAEVTFGKIDSPRDPAGPLARKHVAAAYRDRLCHKEMLQPGENRTDVERQGHDSARDGGWRRRRCVARGDLAGRAGAAQWAAGATDRALAAVAVVRVVGGAPAAALLVFDAGHKTGAIEISQPVGQGQKIPLSSMQEVQVTSGSGIDYVPWNEASQVARPYAATTLPSGALLTPQMTTAENTATKGMIVVGLALKDGQLPDGLS